jgi:hypothetical protein
MRSEPMRAESAKPNPPVSVRGAFPPAWTPASQAWQLPPEPATVCHEYPGAFVARRGQPSEGSIEVALLSGASPMATELGHGFPQ